MNTRFVPWTILAMYLAGVNRLRVRFAVVDSIGTYTDESAASADSGATTTLTGSGPHRQLRTRVRGWQRLRTDSEGAQNQNLRGENRLRELIRVD